MRVAWLRVYCGSERGSLCESGMCGNVGSGGVCVLAMRG